MRFIALTASASVIGVAKLDRYASTAWTNASTPLAAVTERGQLNVSSGATIATSGNKQSLTMPFFICWALSDRIAILVTSEPVPAVVGMAIKGIVRWSTLFSPNNASSGPS